MWASKEEKKYEKLTIKISIFKTRKKYSQCSHIEFLLGILQATLEI